MKWNPFTLRANVQHIIRLVVSIPDRCHLQTTHSQTGHLNSVQKEFNQIPRNHLHHPTTATSNSNGSHQDICEWTINTTQCLHYHPVSNHHPVSQHKWSSHHISLMKLHHPVSPSQSTSQPHKSTSQPSESQESRLKGNQAWHISHPSRTTSKYRRHLNQPSVKCTSI